MRFLQKVLGIWFRFVFASWLVGPFLVAGTFLWSREWMYLAVLVAGVVSGQLYVARKNPALRKRRRTLGANTKRWDLAWNAFFWPLMASAPIAAGFEARGGVAPLPVWVLFLGLPLFAAGISLSAWAMATNPHFEGTVRIQEDHRVVDSGPYRLLRHPGYLALILWACATPLILRSALAIPFAVATALWIALRTALEDRMLQRELPGYREYAQRVRTRLLPEVW